MTTFAANFDLPAACAACGQSVLCGEGTSVKSAKSVKAKGFSSPAMVVLCG